MKRSRGIKKYIESSSESETELGLKKRSCSPEVSKFSKQDESSSESDIEHYLLKPEKLDLDSHFFSTNVSGFEKVEKNIFSGVTRLSGSESEIETSELPQEEIGRKKIEPSVSFKSQSGSAKMNFKQLQDYTKKIEEAKKQIEIYKARKQLREKTDIFNLLVAGEGKFDNETLKASDLHSSDFESSDSEQEGWEEIKTKKLQPSQEKNIVPQGNLQITVDMPTNVKKKKGVDLLAAMKRRLNRIRKENQVLVHKVHLLCWIAHGNYVNSCINTTETLASALSLLPSEQCYPSDRVDLSYLEQIVNWYKRTVKNIDKPVPEYISLDKCLQAQISNKEAYNKKMLVYILIAILRALGIQCRLIISLQVEPLRPPASELHTVSSKSNKDKCMKQTSVSKLKQSKHQTLSVHDVKSLNKGLNTKKNVDTKPCCSKSLFDLKSKESDSPKIETNKRKLILSKNTGSKDKVSSTDNKTLDVASNIQKPINGSKSTNFKQKRRNNTKSKKKDSGGADENDDSNPESRKSLELIDTVRTKTSQRSKKETNDNSKNGLQIEEKIDSNLIIPKLRSHTKSTGTKDSLASIKSDNRSKSVENIKNTRSVRVKLKKNVLQVDGTYDSDNEVETVILQLDGANDNKKPSKSTSTEKSSRSIKEANSKTEYNFHNKEIGKSKVSSETNKTDSESEFEPSSRSPINRKNSSSRQLSSRKKQIDVRNDIVNLIKGRISQHKQLDRSRLAKKRKPNSDSDSDSDYAPEPIKKKFHDSDDDFIPKIKVKRRVQIPQRSVLSENENETEKSKKIGNDVWLEVFLEAEEKWISVDAIYGQVHCIKEIYQRATHPVCYVIAWDNNIRLKDVSQRYCQNFNTVTRKLRVNSKWWNDSLKSFMGTSLARDKEEDDDLARQQLDQPLPKAISEYKNHPLYVLRRHLLKFEALYPSDPPTLGFIRGEAVYPRYCVYTLHSRDIWLKQAKVVKLGEQPYKIVKARPKYDRLSNKVITDQTLEIFGLWQVQDYDPPTAENGLVPKNAFGNVDLFKPCMLPKGCVHLKLPGLNKIARRMNIDCPSAIVGFDFHGGWSHPVYDGYVVCKEYEDQLICAWEVEQDQLEQKEEEKINKRVYGNWKKLIKGLLIRERLKAKYNFGEPSTSHFKYKKYKT